MFSSIPVLDGNSIRLDNTIDYISGIGRIIVGSKSFTNSEQPHKLRIQRMYNGHRLTISEIKILLHEGTVLIDTFDEKGNETKNILQYMKSKQKVSFRQN